MSRLLVFLLLFTPIFLVGQEKISLKRHIDFAKSLVENEDFAAAAAHYEAAWSQKPKKLEYLNHAGELYLKAREYRKAAEAFGTLRDNKHFPKARLYYAMALQHSEQFDEAIPEFLRYLNGYDGKDREALQERIEAYIQGCTIAIRQTDSTKLKQLTIEHLSESINSPDNDIAPLPFGDDILYFTNSVHGKIQLMRAQQTSNDWSRAQIVESLPILAGVAYGFGSFSADGKRFYYAQCEIAPNKKTKKTNCYIYCIKRDEKGWTASQRLSNAVNTEGGIATHPNVFQKDNKEYLLFATDRKGGRGGMDIWYSVRDVDKEEFSAAKTLGSIINTEGDEVSPFYDVKDGTLYFASNGRATFGGLDIFTSKGLDSRWETPINIGTPFNSGADDWFFIQNKSRTGGYFVSNRSVGAEKISSRDDDIFAFKINSRLDIAIAGKVYDKDKKSLLENPRVSLYERRGTDNQRLLSSFICPAGQYQFPILPQKTYLVEVEKDGYNATTYDFNTLEVSKNLEHDFQLDRYGVFVSTKMDKENDKNSYTNIEPATKKTTTNVNIPSNKTSNTDRTSRDNREGGRSKPVLKTTKPTAGVSYKIQVMSYEQTLDATHRRRLSRVEDLGILDFEEAIVNGKKFTRVLLTEFSSYEQATIALKKSKDRSLNDAFIIRYENGKRTNSSK